jgi:hypothetical protein
LVALVIVFAMVLAVAVVKLAVDATERAQAENTADAVALAGAAGDETAARSVAIANEATLLSFTREGDVVLVEVQRHGHRAAARAEAVVTIT